MKAGRTLEALAQELSRIQNSKRDFIAPVPHITMHEDGRVFVGSDSFDATRWASQQMAQWAGIPWQYYERIQGENVELLSRNFNHALSRPAAREERKLVRTLDGNVRAFLSSRYRILDSFDLAETVLPVAQANGLQVASCELTETKLYLKLLSDRLFADVKVGDAVQYGLMVSTSDVGAGSVRVEPFIHRLVCLNGMVSADGRVRKYHVGRELNGQDLGEIVSSETRQQADKAFWMVVRDVVQNSLKPEVFEAQVERLRASTQDRITNFNLPAVVEATAKVVGITNEGTKQSILSHLASGGDLSRWGLANAFTAVANDHGDYEQATQLERAGGLVIELSKQDWAMVANG